MTVDAVLELSQKVGLPALLLIGGAVIVWRLGGTLLRALIQSYQDRIAALETDRLHWRDRAEAHDDRTNGLCRELIDEARARKEARGE